MALNNDAKKYLDLTGLQQFWSKAKGYIDAGDAAALAAAGAAQSAADAAQGTADAAAAAAAAAQGTADAAKGIAEANQAKLVGIDTTVADAIAAATSGVLGDVVKSVATASTDGDLVKASFDATKGDVTLSLDATNLTNALNGKVASGDFDAYKTTVNGKIEALEGADSALDGRVAEIEKLLSPNGANDTLINNVNEVLDWFAGVSEDETGAALLQDVATLKGWAESFATISLAEIDALEGLSAYDPKPTA